jgi:hypothetical protein
MTTLEIKRLKLELIKVAAARAELEFKIEERLEDITRIKSAIKIQLDKEEELNTRIKEAEEAENRKQ